MSRLIKGANLALARLGPSQRRAASTTNPRRRHRRVVHVHELELQRPPEQIRRDTHHVLLHHQRVHPLQDVLVQPAERRRDEPNFLFFRLCQRQRQRRRQHNHIVVKRLDSGFYVLVTNLCEKSKIPATTATNSSQLRSSYGAAQRRSSIPTELFLNDLTLHTTSLHIVVIYSLYI